MRITDSTIVRLIDVSADQHGTPREAWRGTLGVFEADNADSLSAAERDEIRTQLRERGTSRVAGFVGVAYEIEVVATHVLSLVPPAEGTETFHDLVRRLSNTHTVVTDLSSGEIVWCSAPPHTKVRNVGKTTAFINTMFKGRPTPPAA